MTDVVKTTILSKRWKDLWTTLPFLNFEDSDDYTTEYSDDSTSEDSDDYYTMEESVRDFINRALTLWRGIKILRFKINFKSHYDQTFSDDYNVWIRFAKEKEAEEIYIHAKTQYEPYQLPNCLYSSSSLKVLVLSLNYIRLWSIRGNVKLDRLRSLTIDSDYFYLSPRLIRQVLRGSPNLEVLILSLYQVGQNLCIRSRSLKKLSIHKYVDERDTELEIWTPNLETLDFSGFPYGKCWLNASSSLTDVRLRFRDGDPYECGETLRQILPTIQHVQSVRISDWCIKVLVAMRKKHLLSPFSGLKFLRLNKTRHRYFYL